MITLQTRIKRSEHALSSPVAKELVMFDTNAGKYYGLNEIATDIWNRLEKPLAVEKLCDQLTDEFDVSAGECRQDVLNFLPELMDKGLITKAKPD